MSFYLNSFVALTLAIFSDNICIVDIAAHLQASLLPCPGLLIFSVSLNPWRMLTTIRAFCPLVVYLPSHIFPASAWSPFLTANLKHKLVWLEFSHKGERESLHFQNLVSTNQATQSRLPINFIL